MPGPMGRGRGMGAVKPENLKGTIKRLLSYLKPHAGKMVVVFICVLISSFANIGGTAILAPLINGLAVVAPSPDLKLTGIEWLDSYAYGNVTGNLVTDKITYLTILVCTIAAIYVIGLLANYLCNRLLISISTTTMKTMRNQLFTHMQQLPIKVFDTNTHGELMTRFTNDIDVMNEFIARCIPQIVSSILTIIGVFTMMFILSWPLALV
ncbi:MAG: hypothetical protein K2M64_01575, partial [Clostridia bacterium]|nr:hypothetical protein [Clostridia bacterium]